MLKAAAQIPGPVTRRAVENMLGTCAAAFSRSLDRVAATRASHRTLPRNIALGKPPAFPTAVRMAVTFVSIRQENLPPINRFPTLVSLAGIGRGLEQAPCQ